MPDHIECDNCGRIFLAISYREAKPIKYEECPGCSGKAFSFVDE